jgi:NADH:ubiquinone oxidoreductase subunit K
MGRALSILLLLAGAIIFWGVTADYDDVDENVLGIILMVVGAAGALFSIIAEGAGRNERIR